jgi:hypothetical protein
MFPPEISPVARDARIDDRRGVKFAVQDDGQPLADVVFGQVGKFSAPTESNSNSMTGSLVMGSRLGKGALDVFARQAVGQLFLDQIGLNREGAIGFFASSSATGRPAG